VQPAAHKPHHAAAPKKQPAEAKPKPAPKPAHAHRAPAEPGLDLDALEKSLH
jgi:hypothetical protein